MRILVKNARMSTVAVVAFGLLFGACGSDDADLAPVPASPTPSARSVVVTFRVDDREEYRIELTDPEDIAVARALLAGEEAPRIPNGIVVRGATSVNEGYSWHIAPDSVQFADVAVEVCDGLPSFVERNEITSDRYCPWAAVVIAIEEV